MNKTSLFCAAALSLISLSVVAQQQVYKSIDSQGNVTYSSTRPDPGGASAVEQILIAPPPSETEREAAEQRLREIQRKSALREKHQSEAKQEKRASVEAAQTALDEARTALERTKAMGPGDWQTIATGGRVPKQSYLDRVQHAEERVKHAEDALKKARRGR
jgi:hypothetical protein